MDQFDVGRLTDLDFEALCRDLLGERLGLTFELFAPGRDGGIDLRYLADGNATVVVQCKHWATAGRAALLRHMLKTEAPKIRKVDPGRYIVATSVDLTVGAKDKLIAGLAPYVQNGNDVLGIRDIVAELRSRPHLVRRHVRLWLNSAEVLQSIVNSGIAARSAALADEIRDALLTYVVNPSFERARDQLEDAHVCVLAGVPGIGKTTLARALAATYAESGYELVEVSGDAGEVDQVWRDGVPQFFYFDDFLGQTALDDKLNKNEDRRLLNILRRVHQAADKRFVLTTREYILEHAKVKYELLSRYDFDPYTAVVKLGDYSPSIRAQMLYHHVYFSNVSASERAAFSESRNYLPIIRHRNFSPRLVEMSLAGLAVRGADSRPAHERLLANLNQPALLWDHIVRNQLADSEVHVLEVLATMPDLTSLARLEELWSARGEHGGRRTVHRHFLRSVRSLDGTMVKTSHDRRGEIHIAFHNPSIRDYMAGYLADDYAVLNEILASAIDLTQVATVVVLAKGWNGRALLDAIRTNLGELVEAVRRILSQREKPRYDESSITLALGLLGLHEKVNDERLTELSLDLLTEADVTDADAETQVQLMLAMSSSSDASVRAQGAALLPLVLDWITADMGDWDNARFADDMLQQLGEIAPLEVRARVAEALDDAARSVVERVDDGAFSPSTLREVLEHLDAFTDPGAIFDGYASAKARLVEYEATLTPGPAPLLPNNGADPEVTITQIMSALRP